MLAQGPPRVVCFDLDDTVMLRPNSLEYLCRLNRAPEGVLGDIDRRERGGAVDWIAADYERAPLIAGLAVASVEESFDEQLLTIGNLDLVLRTLRHWGVLTVLITSGPVEVAEAFARRFSFDHYFGSEFESGGGPSGCCYTGRITRHLGAAGKLECLRDLCARTRIAVGDCAAVGDGESDIALFKAAGMAIGLNCSKRAAEFVHHHIQGNDLLPILSLLLPEGSP